MLLSMTIENFKSVKSSQTISFEERGWKELVRESPGSA